MVRAEPADPPGRDQRGSQPQRTGLTRSELAAWKGFLATHARLVRELNAQLEQQHDLPLTAYEVLMYLYDAPGRKLRMSELASSVLLSPSGITRLVDRLVVVGLVRKTRCADDRRGYFAELTDAGAVRLEVARVTHLTGVRDRFSSRLTASQQAQLAACWEALKPVGETPAASS